MVLVVYVTMVGTVLEVARLDVISHVLGFVILSSEDSACFLRITKEVDIRTEPQTGVTIHALTDFANGEPFHPHPTTVAPDTHCEGISTDIAMQLLEEWKERFDIMISPLG